MSELIDWAKPIEMAFFFERSKWYPARFITSLRKPSCDNDVKRFVVVTECGTAENIFTFDAYGAGQGVVVRNVEPAPPTSSDGVVYAVDSAKHAAVCAVLDLIKEIADAYECGHREFRIIQTSKLHEAVDKAISTIKNY